jgi:Patched family
MHVPGSFQTVKLTSFNSLFAINRAGPPFDYWSQYDGIQMNLVEIAGASILIAFGISLLFFALKLYHDGHHGKWKILSGSLVGATLIAGTCFFCIISVTGLSILAGVSLTAFSIMSFVLSTAFAVEYCVHIIAKWLRSDRGTALERVEHTMSFLMLPTFMSFGSSAIGVLCLAMTDFEFNTRFFFRPLIITVFVTYFFGCWALPCFLSILDFEFVKLGPHDKNVHSSASHLSKLQGSEPSEMEPSKDEEDVSRSRSPHQSEIQSIHPSDDRLSCITNSLMETDATSLEFLHCYNISDCGGPEKPEDATATRDADDNSLLSEVPVPLYALATSQSLDNYSKETSSLSSYSSNQRSALCSVGSSQITVEVDNTRRSILLKKAHVRPLLPAIYRPYQEEERDAPSLVDALLTESLDATSAEDVSVTSNAFDGIESSSQDERDKSSLLNIDPSSSVASVSSVFASLSSVSAPRMAAVSPLPSYRTTATVTCPVTIDTSPHEILAVDTSPREILTIVGPASTSAIFREREDAHGFLESSIPPLQQSPSTPSPRKKIFSLGKPVGIMIKNSGSQETSTTSAFGSNEILNSSNDELLDGRDSGFDFKHILAIEEPSPHPAVLQPSDTPSPPRSIHSLLTGVSGDVFNPIFEDEEGDDTVNF